MDKASVFPNGVDKAVALTSSAGSDTQPVYFSGGKPVKTTYTLGASVPSGAKFTDTVYTHPYYTAKSSGLYKVTVDSTGHVSATAAVTKSDITGLGLTASDVGAAASSHSHSNYVDISSSQQISGAKTFNSKVNIKAGLTTTSGVNVPAIEIFAGVPYIDFHFGGDVQNITSEDYTARIAEYSNGALTVNGTLSQTSDRRVKENIFPIAENDIYTKLFDRLVPVEYNFKDGNKKTCYGLIAQDIVDVLFEFGIGEDKYDLVHHDFWKEKDGTFKEQYSIAYNNLIALLINEVQKLKKTVKEIIG